MKLTKYLSPKRVETQTSRPAEETHCWKVNIMVFIPPLLLLRMTAFPWFFQRGCTRQLPLNWLKQPPDWAQHRILLVIHSYDVAALFSFASRVNSLTCYITICLKALQGIHVGIWNALNSFYLVNIPLHRKSASKSADCFPFERNNTCGANI